MLRTDYILRLAEQVAAATALALAKGEAGDTRDASEDLVKLCRQHIGLELDTVLCLAPEGLRQLLQQAGSAAVARGAALAEILLAQGEIAEAAGDRSRIVPCYIHAFHLLREATPWVDASVLTAHESKLLTAADTLRELGLTAYVESESARPIGAEPPPETSPA